MKTRFLHRWMLLLSLGLLLLLPTAVGAVYASIDTDDGVIDPDWATVTTFQTSPDDGGIADAYDIKEAKVTRESDNSFWYFQVILYGQLPLDFLTSIEGRISCDGDGDFTGDEDKVILYYHANPPTNDNVIECEGNDYPTCSLGETQGADFGEEIAVGDGTYSYEFKADTSDLGGIDWSTCDGEETIQFVVADETGTTYETTPARNFDVPTVARISRLRARQPAMAGTAILLSLGLVLGALALWGRPRP